MQSQITKSTVITWSIVWRALSFLVLWGAVMAVFFVTSNSSSLDNRNAWVRLWFEAVPCIAMILAHLVMFGWIDKQTSRPPRHKKFTRDALLGLFISLLWLGAIVGTLRAIGALSWEIAPPISLLPVWVIAAAINVAVQEYLVRGYLFTMITKRANIVIATVITTGLFIALHKFQGGVVGVLNVTMASLLFTVLLVRTGSIIAPIIAHAIWNIIGAIVLGVVSLGGHYPEILHAVITRPGIISDGTLIIEGSPVTLVVTTLLVIGLIAFLPKCQTKTTNQ